MPLHKDTSRNHYFLCSCEVFACAIALRTSTNHLVTAVAHLVHGAFLSGCHSKRNADNSGKSCSGVPPCGYARISFPCNSVMAAFTSGDSCGDRAHTCTHTHAHMCGEHCSSTVNWPSKQASKQASKSTSPLQNCLICVINYCYCYCYCYCCCYC